MSVTAQKWTLVKPWDGPPTLENFEMKEEIVDLSLKPGEILCEAMYLSVDPYMRIVPIYEALQKAAGSDTMIGTQVARVTHSECPDLPVGSHVVGELGWRTHTRTTAEKVKPVPDIGALPMSLVLGTLGLTGMTGYLAMKDILDPKTGETFVVSSAAGAVGSLVGQVAKLMGCNVIGFTGSNEKCDWLKKDLGFDHVFNYKQISVDEALKSAAPDGVHCYFDNVGGEFAAGVMKHMTLHGRVAVIGSVSTYMFGDEQPKGTYPYYDIMLKRLRVQGFGGWDHVTRWADSIQTLRAWIEQGKLKYREHITEGFENMPTAFLELCSGKNIGKTVVKTCLVMNGNAKRC